jgi:hypothetical protein
VRVEPGDDGDDEVFRRSETLAATARDLIRIAQARTETARRTRHWCRNTRLLCSLRRDLAAARMRAS